MEEPASVEEPPVAAAEEPVAAVSTSSAVYIDGVLTVIHSKPKEVLISVPTFCALNSTSLLAGIQSARHQHTLLPMC